MSIGRVTSQQLYVNSQQSMAAVKARLSALQEQSSSGLAINRPSDDPAGTSMVLQLRSQLAATTQYGTNISDGLSWLTTVDSALTSSESLVRNASDLTVQAANSGTSSPTTREALAVQLEGVRADLLAQANTQYLGRSVFAGTSDAAAAFSANGTYNGFTATGASGGSVMRRISDTETVAVSADGAAAFGTPPRTTATGTTADTSVFSTLDRIIGALRSSTYDTDTSTTGPQATITKGIDDLKSSLDRLSAQHAVVGSDYSRLTTAKTRNLDVSTDLQKQRSTVQDADTTAVLLDLKTQELAYQTALGVTAQVLQPTLMSFLQ